MKIAKFKMIGKKPLLMHKFNMEVLTDTQKPKEGTTGNNPNEWKKTAIADADMLYVPASYLTACIVAGGKHVKVGRGTISKNVAGTLSVIDEKIYFDNYKLPKSIDEITIEDIGTDSSRNVYVDCRMVANPNTKGRNVRYRLALKAGWQLTPTIEWDDSVISMDQMKAAVNSAGKFVGLSDDRHIGGGRFEVDEFEILK